MQQHSRTIGFVRPSHRIFAFRLIRFTAAHSAVRLPTALLRAPGSELVVLVLEQDVERGEPATGRHGDQDG
jgi:hypothetical protein